MSKMKHTWITYHEDNPEVWDDPDGEYDSQPSCWARHAPDPHNGPKCRKCGFNFCEHCHPEGWDDDNCTSGREALLDGPAATNLAEIGLFQLFINPS